MSTLCLYFTKLSQKEETEMNFTYRKIPYGILSSYPFQLGIILSPFYNSIFNSKVQLLCLVLT